MALKEQVWRDGQEVTVLGQDLAKSGVRPFQQCAPFVLRPGLEQCRQLEERLTRFARLEPMQRVRFVHLLGKRTIDLCEDTTIKRWTRAYLAVDRAEYPHIWQIRDELAGVTGDDIFETILDLVMRGFMAAAPRPCGCGKHAGVRESGVLTPSEQTS